MIPVQAVQNVRDFASLMALLNGELGWPVDPAVPADALTFDWTSGELHISTAAAGRLQGGMVRQLCPFHAGQPWGIFLAEFASTEVYVIALRQVLRDLTPRLRGGADHPVWPTENLLFVCATRDYRAVSFVHFQPDPHVRQRSVLSSFDWERGDSHVRTLCEHNLPSLTYPDDRGADRAGWLKKWGAAWDVKKVTKRFFTNYAAVFGAVKSQIVGPAGDEATSFTQALFNRLLFLAFLQKKEWLNRDRRYLWSLFETAQANRPGGAAGKAANYFADYLHPLFFRALNTPDDRRAAAGWGDLHARLGDVPYLNGGLFEPNGRWDEPGAVSIPNEAMGQVLELFGRYNFTITESTPQDVEVAVDPEMLGRVFEELVTGRHESGSYYTPRPVVAFMCQESLKHYLADALGLVGVTPEIARFVEDGDPAGLADAERTLDSLRRVRVCDPACGSGAYLVGMMQELLRLRAALFHATKLDDRTTYQRKLEIIQRNLYGVDIDRFAVGIAMLRLWLSLVVDDSRHPLNDPTADVSLPNLRFKIQAGDSLTAPSPDTHESIFLQVGYPVQAGKLHDLYEEYFRPTRSPGRRPTAVLDSEISAVRAIIARLVGSVAPASALDWRVAFAEVFAFRGEERGGFDVVLTNPPYLRQEVLKQQFGESYKPLLAQIYPSAYVKTADVYVAFYARAQQLLRPGGVGCFISSNKWLRAGYGEKLRVHLLDAQAFHLVADFGELPVFEAATFPAIFLWQKAPRGGAPTAWTVVKDLEACYAEGVGGHLRRLAVSIPAGQFRPGGARLATATDAGRKAKMEAGRPRLGEVVRGQILRGVLTGLNEAFVVDQATRDALIATDPHSADILKPVLVGDDVRRYEVHFRERYLIWTYVGVPIDRYPAIMAYLERYREKADARWDKGDHWWELRPCDYYAAFEAPKIAYSDLAMSSRFHLDRAGYFLTNTAYIIPSRDAFMVGLLNARPVWDYISQTAMAMGDDQTDGRLRLFRQYLEGLPIPLAASPGDRAAVAALAEQAQGLHGRRRARAEAFLRAVGLEPAASSSRNPLEEPWALSAEDFARRCRGVDARVWSDAREETMALTEEIKKVEDEIDRQVAGLYGLE